MEKVYDHAVIYNGEFYPANTPIKVKTEKKAETPKVEDKEVVEKTTEKKPVKKAGAKNDKGTV